jgi:hypothetical protein
MSFTPVGGRAAEDRVPQSFLNQTRYHSTGQRGDSLPSVHFRFVRKI